MTEGAAYVPSEVGKKKDVESALSYLLMEDVLDKLKLLEYETKFCRQFMRAALKPLRPNYFAVPGPNPSEQFYYMSQIIAWLLNACGQRVTAPSRTDDPNAVTATLIEEVKKLGLNTDFPPNRLKQASGEVVCGVINEMAKVA